MRTTLTIDDELMADLKELAHREGLALKQLVNRLLRLGLESTRQNREQEPYVCPTFAMGQAAVEPLDKALHLATTLEDVEIARKLGLRK